MNFAGNFKIQLPLLMLFLGIYSKGFCQDTYLPINTFTNYHIDRLDIAGKTNGFITSVKPISRAQVNVLNRLDSDSVLYKNSIQYFKTELFEYPLYDTMQEKLISNLVLPTPWRSFKKSLYASPAALYSKKIRDFTLMINPILVISGGKDFSSENSTYQNTRGAEIRGMIDNTVGFYSSITENQFRFPDYYTQIIDSTGVIPGEGFHKGFGGAASDFFQAKGYFTFSPSKHIIAQFGHDRNFIGNGYRSLILSNYSKEYLFLKFNTRIWRFNYQNLFTQLTDFSSQSATGRGIKPKYFVNHYLGVKLFNALDLGVFESVIYDRGDINQPGNFDINYLNPIIFYRAIEHNLNSSDNVIIGLDWKWNIKKRISFYGQFVLDEFVKNELINRTGWWANKYGVQTGLKYINAFTIAGLDLQLEYNLLRPYTYTHFKLSQNYVNYNQALAHPLGANFKEIIAIARYQPFYSLFIEAGIIQAIKGLDSSSQTKHFGGNILTTYENRPYENGHTIGQGVKTVYSILFFNASYMMYHNMWIDARINVRTAKSDLTTHSSNSSWIQLGLRMNLSMRNYDF